MLFDLHKLLSSSGEKVEFDYDVKTENIADVVGTDVKSVKASGSIENHASSLILHLNVVAEIKALCDRCNSEFDSKLDFDVKYNLVKKSNVDDVSESEFAFCDSSIEIDDIVAESIVLNRENKNLCSDDCKGLCTFCGKNLNYGDCSCNKKTIDPRLAKLSEFFD